MKKNELEEIKLKHFGMAALGCGSTVSDNDITWLINRVEDLEAQFSETTSSLKKIAWEACVLRDDQIAEDCLTKLGIARGDGG